MEKSYKELIGGLVQEGVLQTPRIIEAFTKVDRKDFVLPEYAGDANIDSAQPIGYDQTISQPYTVAFMFELLEPKRGEQILDIGSGSGWTTTLLAHIVGYRGYVRGVEIVPTLAVFGQNNLAKYNFPNAHIVGATKELGLSEYAPYDKILVSAESQKVPEELLKQLKIGGIMCIPVLNAIWKIRKISATKTEMEKYEGFVFVPLIIENSCGL